VWGIAKANRILVTAVSVSVCPSPHSYIHCADLDVTWRNGSGCPLVVTIGQINRCTGFVAMTTHTYFNHTLIALYTTNAYSAERETSASVCTRWMARCRSPTLLNKSLTKRILSRIFGKLVSLRFFSLECAPLQCSEWKSMRHILAGQRQMVVWSLTTLLNTVRLYRAFRATTYCKTLYFN